MTSSADERRTRIEDDSLGSQISPGPPEVLSEIQKKRYSTKGEGRGLGVLSARMLLEGCGGTLSIASELGQGTTCALAFPGFYHQPANIPLKNLK